MDYQTIHVTPSTPVIGAEIRGADLTRPLPDQQWREVHDAFLRYSVVFFRDQNPMTPEQQIAFGRRFGELHIHPAAPHMPGYPEVFVIHAHKDSKIANGEFWHSDVSCDVEPPLGSILQIHTLPPSGGDTLFAGMYAAYHDLSPRMKAFLEGLSAVHESEHIYRGRYAERGVNDAGKIIPPRFIPSFARTRKQAGLRSSSTGRLPRGSRACRRKRAAPSCNSSFNMRKAPGIKRASIGRRTTSPCGTTAARSTWRFGITGQMNAKATASR